MPSNISLIATKALRVDSGITYQSANAGFKTINTQETLEYTNAMDPSNTNQGYMSDFENFSNTAGTSLTGDIRYYRYQDASWYPYGHSSFFPYARMSNDDACFMWSPTKGKYGKPMFGIVQGPTNSTGGGTGTGQVNTNQWNSSTNNFLIESSDAYMNRDLATQGLDANDTHNNSTTGTQYCRAYTLSFWCRQMNHTNLGTTETNLTSMFGQGTSGFHMWWPISEVDMWLFFPDSSGTWNGIHTSTIGVANKEIYHNTSKGGVYHRFIPTPGWTHYEFTVIADLDHSGVSHRFDMNSDYSNSGTGAYGFYMYPGAMVSNVKIHARNISMAHEFDAQIDALTGGVGMTDYVNNISLTGTFDDNYVSGDVFD
jgi:hypothetical protein